MNCIKCKAELPGDATPFCPICGKRQAPMARRHRKRANGTGSVYPLSGNRSKPWAAAKNGVLIGTYKTRGEALKALERITDHEITDRYNLTFAQVYELWKPIHDREVSKSQANVYAAAYKSCQELHPLKFRSLRKSDFEAVLQKLEQDGKSKSTCEKLCQLFRQLSALAIDEGIVSQNHAANVKTVAEQKSIGAVFSADQIRRIAASESPAAQIVIILLATGARPGELFSVTLANCFDGYFVGGSKTAAGRNRVIPVASFGVSAYQRLRSDAVAMGGALLIDGYVGNKNYNNFRKREFVPLMQEIGADGMSMYDCRHTFATMAAKSGVKQQYLRRLMGHADISTTDGVYTHLDDMDLVESVSLIEPC